MRSRRIAGFALAFIMLIFSPSEAVSAGGFSESEGRIAAELDYFSSGGRALSDEEERELVRRALEGAVPGEDYREGEALFYLGYDPAEDMIGRARDVAEAYGGELADYQHGMGLISLSAGVEDGEERVTTWDAVERSLEDDDLPVVEPNYRLRILEDSVFSSDGDIGAFNRVYSDPYLERGGEYYQWHHETLHSEAVWGAGYTGSADIRVAVIDTGVTKKHEDLPFVEQMTTTKQSGSRLPLEPDTSTHGTHVAGIIGAAAGNGVGGAGVAPGVTILSYNVQPSEVFTAQAGTSDWDEPDEPDDYEGGGLDYYAIMSSVANAVSDGADIINMSLGGADYSYNFQRVINDAYNAGISIFAAMGNEYSNCMIYPAAYDRVIAVASVGISGARSDFSNFGPWCDIAAPGNSIISTVVPHLVEDIDYDDYYIYDGRYGEMSGTSMATPVAAGCAALYMSAHGNPGPAAMERLLKESARASVSDDIGAGVVDLAGLMGVDQALISVSPTQSRSLILGISGKEQLKPGASAKYRAYLSSRSLPSEYTKASWSVSGPGANHAKITEKNGILNVKLKKKAPVGSVLKIRATAAGGLTAETEITVSKAKAKSLRVTLKEGTSGNVTLNKKGGVTKISLYVLDHPDTWQDDRSVELVQTGASSPVWSIVSDKEIVTMTGEGLDDPQGAIILKALGLGEGTLVCDASDNSGKRLEIPIEVVYPPSSLGIYEKSLGSTDSPDESVVGAGGYIDLGAVPVDGYGETAGSADVKWSIVGYGGVKKKAISSKSVSINKNGRLKVKSNIWKYYNGGGWLPFVVIRASLKDGSDIGGEEVVYISERVTSVKKNKYWYPIWLGDVKDVDMTGTPETYGEGSGAVLIFRSNRPLDQWTVTSSDPAVAAGYIRDIYQKGKYTYYFIYLNGGTKSGRATITAKALDGGGKGVTWRVENK